VRGESASLTIQPHMAGTASLNHGVPSTQLGSFQGNEKHTTVTSSLGVTVVCFPHSLPGHWSLWSWVSQPRSRRDT
jgi:hypothetical protein